MESIRWEFYPSVAENQYARSWLEIQSKLGLASNTIRAYGRGANDYLVFCQRSGCPFLEATQADIVAYVDDMTHRPNPKGDHIRYLHSGTGLANATMQQRLTVVRLLYDYLIDERLRSDERNPVGKGKYTPGRAFAGKRERGLLRHYERLPWIPGSDEWEAILDATNVNACVILRRDNFDHPFVLCFLPITNLQSSLSRLFCHTADQCGPHPTVGRLHLDTLWWTAGAETSEREIYLRACHARSSRLPSLPQASRSYDPPPPLPQLAHS